MEDKKISNLLKEIRTKNNMSMDKVVEELSKQGIDINKSSLSRIESGDRQKIDSTLLVGLSNLYHFNFFKYIGLNEKLNNNLNTTGNAKILTDEILINIPVMAKASAGNGYLNFSNQPLYNKLIRKNGFHEHCYLIEVAGNSMEPLIQDGAFVVVDPYQTDYLEGKVYVIKYEDEVYIKRVLLKPEAKVMILKSINQDYEDKYISIDQAEQIKIIGRAVKFIYEGNL